MQKKIIFFRPVDQSGRLGPSTTLRQLADALNLSISDGSRARGRLFQDVVVVAIRRRFCASTATHSGAFQPTPSSGRFRYLLGFEVSSKARIITRHFIFLHYRVLCVLESFEKSVQQWTLIKRMAMRIKVFDIRVVQPSSILIL